MARRYEDHVFIGKAIPVQAWTGCEGSRRFQDSRHMKVVRLSALSTGHLLPPRNSSDTIGYHAFVGHTNPTYFDPFPI